MAVLRRRDGEVDGSKAFVDVLQLCGEYGTPAVTGAVREALRYPEASLGLVRFHLWNAVEEHEAPPTPIDYPGPKVRPSSVAEYATLLRGAEVSRG